MPRILNNIFFQLFLVLGLSFENVLLGLPTLIFYLFILVFWLDVSYYSYLYNPSFVGYNIALVLFLLKTYTRTRDLLLDFEVLDRDLINKKPEDLSWSFLINHISVVSMKFFHQPVVDKLKTKDNFPNFAKRYLSFGRVKAAGEASTSFFSNAFRTLWETIREHPAASATVTGILGTLGAGGGFAIHEMGENHRKSMELHGPEALARAKLLEEQTRKLKRENDNSELKIKLETNMEELQKKIDKAKEELEAIQSQITVVRPDKDPATSLSCVLEESFLLFLF
jgi:hypothetical protein